jgi:hypothetical protein
MPFWSSWKSFLPSFHRRPSSLTRARRQHILRRHRRSFLEPLEARQLMAVAPVLSGLSNTTGSYIENQWLTFLPTANGAISDADSANFNGGSLTATLGGSHADDVLGVQWGGQITTTFTDIPLNMGTVKYGTQVMGTFSGGLGSSPLVIQLNAFATPARTQALLHNLAFRNAGDNPGTARTVNFSVKDELGNVSNSQFVSLAITTDDDAPVLGGGGTTTQYVENAWLTTPMSGGTVSDDNLVFDGGTLTVAITAGGHADDVLGIMNIGNNANQTSVSGNSVYSSGQLIGTFSGGLNLAPLVVSLNSAATPGRTQTLLRNIAYRNSGNNPSSDTRTITFTLSDGSSGSNSPSVAVNVVPVNDAPLISGVSGSTTYTEGAWLESLPLASATISDPDDATFSGGWLKAQITANAQPDDVLGIKWGNSISVDTSAATVSYGTNIIGTYTGGTRL